MLNEYVKKGHQLRFGKAIIKRPPPIAYRYIGRHIYDPFHSNNKWNHWSSQYASKRYVALDLISPKKKRFSDTYFFFCFLIRFNSSVFDQKERKPKGFTHLASEINSTVSINSLIYENVWDDNRF